MLAGERVQPTVMGSRSCGAAARVPVYGSTARTLLSPIRPLSRRTWQLLLPSFILIVASCGLIQDHSTAFPTAADDGCPHWRRELRYKRQSDLPIAATQSSLHSHPLIHRCVSSY